MDKPDVWNMNRKEARDYALRLESKLEKAWEERDKAESELAKAREAMREFCNELCSTGPAENCESECCPFHSFVGKQQ